MPFGRYARRYAGRRRRFRRSRRGLFQRTRTIVNRIAETKYLNVDAGAANAPSTVWVFNTFFQGLVQGTGATNRLGSQIFLRRVDVMVTLYPVTADMISNRPSEFCRLMIYRNKQCNSTAASYNLFFDTNDFDSLRSVPNIRRVSILRDYSHCMTTLTDTNAAGTATVAGSINFQWTVFPRKVIQFISNNGDITDLATNDYGFAFCSSNLGCCSIGLKYKLWFNDV